MYAYKDLLELAGLTTRLYTLTSTLLHMPSGKGVRMVKRGGAISLVGVDVCIPRKFELEGGEMEKVEGEKEDDDPLVKDLDLRIEAGDHLMITGSNGVGKTSVARVLAGLWDPKEGEVVMPEDGDAEEPSPSLPSANALGKYKRSWARPTVYVVPQRSYMVTGSLLEQIIYPCSFSTFQTLANDTGYFASPEDAYDEIHSILADVFLAYLPEREGGLHTRKEWRDVLSGGEKQRMGIARVLWWAPRYTVLDECTSAVSSDVEGRMYEVMKGRGMTLVTISLRAGLIRYHEWVLELRGPSGAKAGGSTADSDSVDGESVGDIEDDGGNWTLSRVGTKEERMSVEKEIRHLEEKLKKKEEWEERVKELDTLLKVVELPVSETKESEQSERDASELGGSVVHVEVESSSSLD